MLRIVILVYALFLQKALAAPQGLNNKAPGKHESDYDLWPLSKNLSTKDASQVKDKGAWEDFEDDWEPISDDEMNKIMGMKQAKSKSMEGRRFVTLHKLSSGKVVERPVQFMRRERYDNGDDVNVEARLRRQPQEDEAQSVTTTLVPETTMMSTEKESGGSSRPHGYIVGVGGKQILDAQTLWNLSQIPDSFTSGVVYIQYTHQLTALERAGDTNAKPGDPCAPKTILESDYCERAAYPNKNKMFCNSVNDDTLGLQKNTCTCKFFRTTESGNQWKQLKQKKMNLNGMEIETCLVPKFGVCNHRISTGLIDKLGRPIYEVDVCQGHLQCDNSQFKESITNDVNGMKKPVMFLEKHCSESDFISQFDLSVQSKVLVCSKPNPNRFEDYDEFKYYCLPKESRDAEQRHFRPVNADKIEPTEPQAENEEEQ